MNILVIGGMHGNEPLGPNLIASLAQNPIPNVTPLLANPPAIKANTRFVEQDLNRSFPGSPNSPTYEMRRAAEILRQSSNYDLILDFHNTLCPDNDCAFVGPNPSPLLLQTATRLSLNRIIVAEYDCINKFAPHCLSVEISVTSPLMSISYWRSLLAILAQSSELTGRSNVEIYQYVRTLTTEDRDNYQLESAGLRVFEPIPPELALRLGYAEGAICPIFLAQNYSAGVYAGLVKKMQNYRNN